MQRALIVCGFALLVACDGGQDDGAPCVLELNIADRSGNIYVGNTIPLAADLSVESGTCSVTNQNVLWESSSTSIAEILTFNNTEATIRARGQGNVYIKAWLALSPSVRDSTLLTIITAVDTTAATSP